MPRPKGDGEDDGNDESQGAAGSPSDPSSLAMTVAPIAPPSVLVASDAGTVTAGAVPFQLEAKTTQPVLSGWKGATSPLKNASLAFAARVSLNAQAPVESSPLPPVAESQEPTFADTDLPKTTTPANLPQHPLPAPNPRAAENTASESPAADDKSASATKPGADDTAASLKSAPLITPPPKVSHDDPPAAPASHETGEGFIASPHLTPASGTPTEHAPSVHKQVAASPAAEIPPAPESPAAPVRDLSLRLNSGDGDRVEVKITERSGEMRVAVRSADSALSTSLQSNLSDLVGKLQSRGFHAETWKPQAEATSNTHGASASRDGQQQEQSAGGQGGQQRNWQRPQAAASRRGKPDRPSWVQEFDSSLEGDKTQ